MVHRFHVIKFKPSRTITNILKLAEQHIHFVAGKEQDCMTCTLSRDLNVLSTKEAEIKQKAPPPLPPRLIPFTAPPCKHFWAEKCSHMPTNGISDGPITNLHSTLCTLIEIFFTCACEGGNKGLTDFKFGAFSGCFQSDAVASMAVKGLKKSRTNLSQTLWWWCLYTVIIYTSHNLHT